MTDPYTPLIELLRGGHEYVKVAIECEVADKEDFSSDNSIAAIKAGSATSDTSSGSSMDVKNLNSKAHVGTLSRKRIFALVINVDQGYEEGCILVCKRRSRDQYLVKVEDGLPILASFRASAEQVGRGVADHGNSSSPSSSSIIKMSLASKTLTATSKDTQAVIDFLKVLREAINNASKQSLAGRRTHRWVERYMEIDWIDAQNCTPIFSRFSSSSFTPQGNVIRPRASSPPAHQLSIGFGTYNVNGHIPSTTDDLKSWLNVAKDEPDILIVGLQEADNSGISYVVWTPHVEAAWTEAIERSMHRSAADYAKLACKQLVGVLICVYVRTGLLSRISTTLTASVGIGFGGWLANKGAVAIRFVLDRTSFCFVVSHLSAFHTVEARERRRWEYHEIVKRLNFLISTPIGMIRKNEADEPRAQVEVIASQAENMLRRQLDESNAMSAGAKSLSESGSGGEDNADGASIEDVEIQQWCILDHDIVLWGGDLNFRIELHESDTKRLIRRGQWREMLFEYDQLQREMRTGSCFVGFQEHVLDFPPTYKFDRGTDTYDTSDKHRNPAWTDRILFRTRLESSNGEQGSLLLQIKPVIYESIPELRMSDHKPVYALFHLSL